MASNFQLELPDANSHFRRIIKHSLFLESASGSDFSKILKHLLKFDVAPFNQSDRFPPIKLYEQLMKNLSNFFSNVESINLIYKRDHNGLLIVQVLDRIYDIFIKTYLVAEEIQATEKQKVQRLLAKCYETVASQRVYHYNSKKEKEQECTTLIDNFENLSLTWSFGEFEKRKQGRRESDAKKQLEDIERERKICLEAIEFAIKLYQSLLQFDEKIYEEMAVLYRQKAEISRDKNEKIVNFFFAFKCYQHAGAGMHIFMQRCMDEFNRLLEMETELSSENLLNPCETLMQAVNLSQEGLKFTGSRNEFQMLDMLAVSTRRIRLITRKLQVLKGECKVAKENYEKLKVAKLKLESSTWYPLKNMSGINYKIVVNPLIQPSPYFINTTTKTKQLPSLLINGTTFEVHSYEGNTYFLIDENKEGLTIFQIELYIAQDKIICKIFPYLYEGWYLVKPNLSLNQYNFNHNTRSINFSFDWHDFYSKHFKESIANILQHLNSEKLSKVFEFFMDVNKTHVIQSQEGMYQNLREKFIILIQNKEGFSKFSSRDTEDTEDFLHVLAKCAVYFLGPRGDNPGKEKIGFYYLALALENEASRIFSSLEKPLLDQTSEPSLSAGDSKGQREMELSKNNCLMLAQRALDAFDELGNNIVGNESEVYVYKARLHKMMATLSPEIQDKIHHLYYARCCFSKIDAKQTEEANECLKTLLKLFEENSPEGLNFPLQDIPFNEIELEKLILSQVLKNVGQSKMLLKLLNDFCFRFEKFKEQYKLLEDRLKRFEEERQRNSVDKDDVRGSFHPQFTSESSPQMQESTQKPTQQSTSSGVVKDYGK